MKRTHAARRVLASVVTGLLFVVLSGCGGSSSSQGSQNSGASLGNTVDSLVQGHMQLYGIPGISVALAKNGTIIYTRGYGVTELASRQATQPGTVYEVGSITKQFTAALIMKLQEQGRLHVDDLLATYLPEYNFPATITLRMMLNHTSGLADFTNFPQLGDWIRNGVDEATVLTAVSQAGLVFPPGSRYSYSNSNYFALGTIIEKLSGQSYEMELQQLILQPLGLSNTYYELPPPAESAVGYTNQGNVLVPATLWNRSSAFAAGALSSNVNDLVTWSNSLRTGKVVSADSFRAMTTSNGFSNGSGSSYGFGLELWSFNGRPLMWHSGQIGGFWTETSTIMDDGFTVVVLTNDQDIDTDPLVIKIMDAVCNSSQLSGNC